jgi:hypothetical protein
LLPALSARLPFCTPKKIRPRKSQIRICPRQPTHHPSPQTTDKLSLDFGVDYVRTPHIPAVPGNDQRWGGVGGYVSYALDPRFTLNIRLEWYKDDLNGYSTDAQTSADCYAVTAGVAIKPFLDKKNDVTPAFPPGSSLRLCKPAGF